MADNLRKHISLFRNALKTKKVLYKIQTKVRCGYILTIPKNKSQTSHKRVTNESQKISLNIRQGYIVKIRSEREMRKVLV